MHTIIARTGHGTPLGFAHPWPQPPAAAAPTHLEQRGQQVERLQPQVLVAAARRLQQHHGQRAWQQCRHAAQQALQLPPLQPALLLGEEVGQGGSSRLLALDLGGGGGTSRQQVA